MPDVSTHQALMPEMTTHRSAVGTILVLVSATCFGTLAIFAKLGYRAGFGPEQLLANRFLAGAAGMVVVALVAGQRPLGLPRRALGALLLLGVLYAGQAFAFFFALRTLPASLVELVLYTYPALVALAAWALYRKRPSPLHLGALLVSFVGVALLLGGVTAAAGVGLLFAIASPLVYTTYILAGDRLMREVPAISAAALTLTGAAVTWTLAAALTGNLRPPPGPAAWVILAGLAVIPTMIASTTFLAALPLIGGGRAALLSTWEPVVTVTLAVLLLGDRLSPLQVFGGLLVLVAVGGLQWSAGGRDQPQG